MVPSDYLMIFEKCFDNKKMRGFAASLEGEKGIWYRTPNGDKIVQAYLLDNGPDYFEKGLARFIEEGKIGFMDEELNKVIPAQFDGAFPFKMGKAKVCIGCTRIYDGEYSTLQGGSWMEINTKGATINSISEQ